MKDLLFLVRALSFLLINFFVFGLMIASARADGSEVTIRPLVQIGHNALVKALSFSSDDKLLASASWDGTVRIWDWKSGRLLRTFTGAGSQAETVAFQPTSERTLATGDERGVYVWDALSGNEVARLELPSVSEVAWTPDGSGLVVATWRGTYYWSPIHSPQAIQMSSVDARSVSVSPDG
ncbi:MAG: hypothetical protein AAFU69_05475, partial [Pseudomonadota bacterium]